MQSGGKVIDIRNADSPGFGNWPKSIALAKLVIAAPALIARIDAAILAGRRQPRCS